MDIDQNYLIDLPKGTTIIPSHKNMYTKIIYRNPLLNIIRDITKGNIFIDKGENRGIIINDLCDFCVDTKELTIEGNIKRLIASKMWREYEVIDYYQSFKELSPSAVMHNESSINKIRKILIE